MKNKLKAELKDLAEKIIQNKDSSSIKELKEQAKRLYEKLTILAFTEENLAAFSEDATKEETPAAKAEFSKQVEPKPSEPKPEETEAPKVAAKKEVQSEIFFEPKLSPMAEKQNAPLGTFEKDEYLPDGTEYNDAEAITEPNTEKIKDIVAQMPPETDRLDYMVNKIISKNQSFNHSSHSPISQPKEQPKNDFRNIGVDYDNLPNFEPVSRQEKERPKSLNDKLKKGFNVGLNERLAFIRHLFDGKTADYNRVISQLNTFDSKEEAKKFIQLVVKPDYKNWQGKEEFENKFMELVENKFA